MGGHPALPRKFSEILDPVAPSEAPNPLIDRDPHAAIAARRHRVQLQRVGRPRTGQLSPISSTAIKGKIAAVCKELSGAIGRYAAGQAATVGETRYQIDEPLA